MKHIFIFLVLITSQISFAGTSAIRLPNETYKQARQRVLGETSSYTSTNGDVSAEGAAVPFNDLNLKTFIDKLVDWNDQNLMLSAFHYVRDLRFFELNSEPGFLRRTSWLYPDDGCYMRAGVVKHLLDQANKYPVISKVFVFGNLSVRTPNARSGVVSWWYHVAPIIRIGVQPYVLDPAIEPKNPLKLVDWLSLQNSKPTNLVLSICHANAYEPWNACSSSSEISENALYQDQTEFLISEKDNLISLGRDPMKELGDHPPW